MSSAVADSATKYPTKTGIRIGIQEPETSIQSYDRRMMIQSKGSLGMQSKILTVIEKVHSNLETMNEIK